MSKKQVLLSIWTVLFLTVLVVGCTKSVAPEDIYRYSPEYPQESGAKNVTVEQTPGGISVSGSEGRVTAPPTTAITQVGGLTSGRYCNTI